MSDLKKSDAQRQLGYDNVKFLLILLVVMGHFLRPFLGGSSENILSRGIYLWIYSFHMPLFLFISGLFAHRYRREESCNWRRIAALCAIGFLLKGTIALSKLVMGQGWHYHIFYDTGIPWFLFILAWYQLLSWLFRQTDGRLVTLVMLAAALLAGYVPWISNFLYLSRVLVFAPFYFAGQTLDPQRLMRALHRLPIRIAGSGTLILWAVLCAQWRGLFRLQRLFSARFSYEEIPITDCGPLHRLLCLLISAALGLAILSVIPNCSLGPFTRFGRKTMQIYFWHRPILYLGQFSGLTAILWQGGIVGRMIFFACAAALTLALCHPVFSFPTKQILRFGQSTHTSASPLAPAPPGSNQAIT